MSLTGGTEYRLNACTLFLYAPINIIVKSIKISNIHNIIDLTAIIWYNQP